MTSSPVNVKPEFAANLADATVADAINTHLAWLADDRKEPVDLAIATAYFNAEGFACLANELERVGKVRLLLGAEPEGVDRHVRRLKEESLRRADRTRLRSALSIQSAALASERNLLGFSYEADRLARCLVEWLGSDRVEVRRFGKGFLHGKAFIVTTHHEGVIAGSSNFTKAGLTTNVELNLGHYQPRVVQQVSAWFDDLWEQSEQFDLAGVYESRFAPHSPHAIYMRMLLARYGAELDDELSQSGFSTLQLASFQRDGVWRAKRTLAEYGGVLIADEVGLGKTFLAGDLIREAIEVRRQRVLVIAPATLRDGPWRVFGEDFGLKYDTMSFDELARAFAPDGNWPFRTGPDEYAMVVIDEAHAFRNPDTSRANALRMLLQGTPPKQLVMLTATPVNNSLWDLYYLVTLFVHDDARFADRAIMSLRDLFKEAEQLDPADLSPEHLFDVIDAIAVRRTRSFVKRHYPNDTIIGPGGRPVTISFPEPVVTKITYNLDEAYPNLLARVAHALSWSPTDHDDERIAALAPPDDARVLRLARYVPSLYRTDGETEATELSIAGLLRSGLLKRFESSAHAFEQTCRRMANSNQQFLNLLDITPVTM